MQFGPTVPILRMFDTEKARAFYVGFLGFQVDWEHRFGDDFPLYMQVSRGDCRLHLSEHHGDCSPGAAVRISVGDVDAFCAEITGRQYAYARPQVEAMPWDSREMKVTDPFANRLIFVDARA
jgi:uncharacterized glyoxalase superfamily protein PhnB